MRSAVLVVACAALTISLDAQAPPASTSLLVRNGRLLDGTGAPARAADVRVAGDSIVEIAEGLQARPGEQVIDAGRHVVAPGFIDMHSHADRGLADDPGAATQIQQGITTSFVGQDGGGELPVSDLLDDIEAAKPAINIATMVGHGAVRGVVMGSDFKRPATPAEIETMKALVERGMKDGAFGLSSGLEYDPGFYATEDELVALAAVVKPYGGFYASHVRDEENEVFAAWSEAIDVGRRAGVAVEISHMKLASKPVWGQVRRALAIVDQARREGLDVTGDWYPYPYWQSAMYVLIPDRDFENTAKWAKGLDEIGGPGHVLVTSYKPDSTWNGRTLAELAEQQHTGAASLIVRMVKDAGPGIGIIGTSMDEDDMRAILAHPGVIICSDGALSGRHPRGYGAFPRVLARYVREQHVLSLEQAVAKMTGQTARRIGLADRGVIAVGNKADLVIFDPAAIADRGTPQDPAQAPVGIDAVIVNGTVELKDGHVTGARGGRALRKGPPPS